MPDANGIRLLLSAAQSARRQRLLRSFSVQLRPRLQRHLHHVSISVPQTKRDLSHSEWATIGQAWCDGMGLDHYMIVLHSGHSHFLASRIRIRWARSRSADHTQQREPKPTLTYGPRRPVEAGKIQYSLNKFKIAEIFQILLVVGLI